MFDKPHIERSKIKMPDGTEIEVGADREKLIENINFSFAENHKSIEEISYEDLMYYLECMFFWAKINAENYRKFLKDDKSTP